MSNANELLRHALDALNWLEHPLLTKDIRAFLAAEPEAEPVLYWYKFLDEDGYEDECFLAGPPEENEFLNAIQVTPLYLHPPNPSPSRKPMTEEEMRPAMEHRAIDAFSFVVGVREAERHHEIGGG